MLGVGIVLALVGLASNVAIGLWARTSVDAAADDAARRVATTPDGADAAARARDAAAAARASLGPYGEDVELTFESVGPPEVVLHVRAPGIALLPRLVDGGPVVGAIDRRVVVHREAGPP